MKYVRPKKSLGQHFLKDLTIAEKIANTIDKYIDLPILEVGPGTGVLTQFLLQKSSKISVVELDRESVLYLKEHFPNLQENIIEEDFLKLDLDSIFSEKFCVIGNYPYNISSQIFFKILDYKDKIPCCAGMIQKELAERIASKPGKKTSGIISILLQTWYDIEYLFTVNENVFNPPPKVKSAVIRLIRNDRKELLCNEKLYKTVIKTAFNQRRKTMRNSLKSLLGKDCEIFVDPVFDKRPEQLSVEEFIDLTKKIEKCIF